MSDRQKAFVLMFFSTLSMSFMQIIVKISSSTLPTMMQVFFRNFVTLFVGLFFVWRSKAPLFGHRESRPALLGRSLFGFFGIVSYFYATAHMNVADASLLQNSSPFFVILFSALLLHNRVTRVQLAALLLAFLGSVIVINPSFDVNMLPALVCVVSAASVGMAYILINKLNGKESNATIVFHFSLLSCVLSFILGFRDFVRPTGEQLIMLLAIGGFAGIGQMLLTQAYKMANPGEVSIMNYVGMIFSAILGFFILGEELGLRSLIGMVLIISAALLLYFIKNSKEIENRRVSTIE